MPQPASNTVMSRLNTSLLNKQGAFSDPGSGSGLVGQEYDPVHAAMAAKLCSEAAWDQAKKKKLFMQACSHCGLAPGDMEAGPTGQPVKLSQCSGCKEAKYCSRQCQMAHWKGGHKAECKLRAEERRQKAAESGAH